MSQDTITPNRHSSGAPGGRSRGKLVAATVGTAVAVGAAAVGITLAMTHSSSTASNPPASVPTSSSAAQLPAQPNGGSDFTKGTTVPAQPVDKTTPTCNDGNITITEGATGVTHNDGEVSVVLDFTNTSSVACAVSGYPGAYTIDGQGRQLQVATQIKGNPNSPTRITLQPGEFAITLIAEIPNPGNSTVRLNTAVPNTAVSHTLPFEWPVGTAMTVEPMQVSPR